MSIFSFFSKEQPPSQEAQEVLQSLPLIERIRKNTHNKITNLLGPFSRVGHWVKEKIHAFLPGFFAEELEVITVPVKDALKTEAPPPTEVSPAPSTSTEAQHQLELKRILKEFTEISQSKEVISLRHGDGKDVPPQRTSELDQLARSRFNTMQADGAKWLEDQVLKMKGSGKKPEEIEQFRKKREGGYLTEHNKEWLKSHHCAENILSGFYSSGREIAQAFLDSDVHRKNILGSYKEMGLAIEVLKDVETGEQKYFVVSLYRNGVEHPDKAPPKLDAPVLQEEPLLDLSPQYLSELEATLKQAGLTVNIERDDELTMKMIPDKELQRGTFVARFTFPDGKKLHYILSQRPSHLVRVKNAKPIGHELLFKDFLEDFKKALRDEAIPSASDLKKQFAQPFTTQGVPDPEKVKEKEPEVVGLS